MNNRNCSLAKMFEGNDASSKCFLCSSTLSSSALDGQVEESQPLGVRIIQRKSNSTLVDVDNPSNIEKARKETVLKYLLSGCQDVNLKRRLISSSPLFKLCNSCEQVATNILGLHVQLEALQTKLIEELKKLKTLIVNSNSKRLHGGPDKRRKLAVDGDNNMDFSYAKLLLQFQEFISENYKHQVEIPLLSLEMFTGTGHLPPNISPFSPPPKTSPPPTQVNIREHLVKNNVFSEDCSLEIGTELGDDDHINTSKLTTGESTLSGWTPQENEKTLVKQENISDSEDEDPLQTTGGHSTSEGEDDDDDTDSNCGNDQLPPGQEVLRMKRTLKNGKTKLVFLCDQCPYESKRGTGMEFHYRHHHEKDESEKPHQCSKCSSKFSVEQALALHIHFHHNPKFTTKRVCDLCGLFSTWSKADWEAHLATVHPQAQRFECDLCEDVFVNFVKLIVHSKYRHSSRKLKCALCPNPKDGPLLKTPSVLGRHLDEVHGVPDFRRECDFPSCSQLLYSPFQLTKHKEKCHQTSFPCEECSLDFSSYSAFRNHHNQVHNDKNKKRRHKCDLCSRGFTYIGALLKHSIDEHKLPGLKCELCPSSSSEKFFTSSLSLWKHRQLLHMDPEKKVTFICSLCSKQFTTKRAMKMHELTHATSKNFSCDKCDFVTNAQCNLVKHSRKLHPPEKMEFTCEICGFVTTSRTYLRMHVKRHEEGRAYGCSECDKKFSSVQVLKQHRFTHGEERTFQCHLCGRSFKHKPSLQLHNRRKHRNGGLGRVSWPRERGTTKSCTELSKDVMINVNTI